MSGDLQSALDAALRLAVQRHQAGDLSSAEALYRRVLAAAPATPGALHNLGLILVDRGDLDTGLQLLEDAVRAAPDAATMRYALAVALQKSGQLSAAIAAYRAVLAIDRSHVAAWENLGVALQDHGAPGDAATAYRTALRLRPDSKIASHNLVNVLRESGDLDDAIAACDRALMQDPADGDLHMARGTTLLALGQFAAGWNEFEWRYGAAEQLAKAPPRLLPLPKWDGSPLAGKRIMLYGEQGIGDEIMFASCVPDVAGQAGATVLECDPRLEALFARSFPTVEVVGRPDERYPCTIRSEPAPDWRLSTASLPGYFRLGEAEFGAGAAFLSADAFQVEACRRRLAALGPGMKVGIAWRGGSDSRSQAARSVPLPLWQALISGSNAEFISLQHGDHHEEIGRFNATSPRPVHCLEGIDPLRDVDRFASLIAALDLVISVDNSTVHLAGALGTPTWVMLPGNADYRWLRDREDSPWYGSHRLFRQRLHDPAGWQPLLERVGSALREWTPAAPPRSARPDHPATPIVPAAQAKTQRRLLLLNDTTYWYHWGCSCTSLALHAGFRSRDFEVVSVPISRTARLSSLPRDAAEFDSTAVYAAFALEHPDLVAEIEAADVVVVNGEGTLHDIGHSALGLLYLTYVAARHCAKRVQIINHSCYPGSADPALHDAALQVYRTVYRALDFIAVREPASAAALRALGIDATTAFDCLPLFVDSVPVHAERTDSFVIAGSVAWTPAMVDQLVAAATLAQARGLAVKILVGANAYPAADDASFVKALLPRLSGDCELVHARTETAWLQTIAEARLLISGRFHHSIAAATLGTPLLIGESNTGKLDGLVEVLGLAPEQVRFGPGLPLPEQCAAMLDRPEVGLVVREQRSALLALARNNFLGLDRLRNP